MFKNLLVQLLLGLVNFAGTASDGESNPSESLKQAIRNFHAGLRKEDIDQQKQALLNRPIGWRQ